MFTKNYDPGYWIGYTWQGWDPYDGRRLAMNVAVIVVYCVNGYKHATLFSGKQELVFQWSRLYEDWDNDPTVNTTE